MLTRPQTIPQMRLKDWLADWWSTFVGVTIVGYDKRVVSTLLTGLLVKQAQTQSHQKNSVAVNSMFASAALFVVKLVAAALTGSLAILGEAIHSLIDLGATVVTVFAVRMSDKPADSDHHFGHAKVEGVAAFAECMLLGVTAAGLGSAAVWRLWTAEHHVDFTWWALGLLLVSIAIDFNRYRKLARVAEDTSSEALAADALHFRTDMWSSVAILTGLLFVLAGYAWVDSLAALAVAVFIAWSAWSLGIKTVSGLTDQAPHGVVDTVQAIAEEQSGILGIERIRIRAIGKQTFIEAGVRVPRTMSATAIEQTIGEARDKVSAALAHADVIFTAIPVELDTETAHERVALLARHRNLAIHHLIVQKLEDRLAISYDLEVDGDLGLADAHDLATELESAVRSNFGAEVEVETHIEPMFEADVAGQNCNSTTVVAFTKSLKKLASVEKLVSDIHSVRVRQSGPDIFVHYHCRFPPNTTVTVVHEVLDRIEDAMKARTPGLRRVVAHSEPLGLASHAL